MLLPLHVLLQWDKGMPHHPPVSLPRVPTHCPLATAAAEPPDDPPGTRSRSQGFLVTCTLFSAWGWGLIATSQILVARGKRPFSHLVVA